MTQDRLQAAFPHTAADGHRDYEPGMSLRDYFAAQFMAVADEYAKQATQNQIIELFGDRGGIRREEIAAAVAYRMADAMIARRSRK
jgi:hypothetical protein